MAAVIGFVPTTENAGPEYERRHVAVEMNTAHKSFHHYPVQHSIAAVVRAAVEKTGSYYRCDIEE